MGRTPSLSTPQARPSGRRVTLDPIIVLLAAGASSRMLGADKLLEPVDGMPLLRRQALAALATGLPVLVALPAPDAARGGALDGLAVERVPVPDAGRGMGHSIAAAARAAPDGCPIAILAADMPGLGTSEINSVTRAFRTDPDRIWRGMSYGTPGHPVIFPARFRAELASLTGDTGARALIVREGALPVPLAGDAAILDLDTPEAWLAWRHRQAP